MSIYTSESPETLTDTVQRAHAVHEESLFISLCNMPDNAHNSLHVTLLQL